MQRFGCGGLLGMVSRVGTDRVVSVCAGDHEGEVVVRDT